MFETIRDKRVLVTGSSSGIGAAIAELFAKYGARVGLHYGHSESAALDVLNTIEQHGGQARVFRGDLIKSSDRRKLVPSFIEAFGGIDVLINSAGVAGDYVHFAELEEETWDRVFAVNVKAPFYLCGDALAHMKQQRWGRIINISTVSIKYAGANSLHYTASKAALEAVTLGISRDGAKHNVLVNSIRCGVIDTPMRTKIAGYNEELFRQRVSLVPVGHAGMPIDIARMALFLTSECGDFITGECFTVAGGD